jgi:Fe-S-cluster-containing dehydrogenase component
MAIKRRDFLKAAGCGALSAVCAPLTPAQAREAKERLPDALGILYDATLCIGCQACMTACKKANGLPPEHSGPEKIYDNPPDLSAQTFNIIKRYGSDREHSFVKRQCMHCVDPACVSACPVSALTKNPRTGIVTYNKDACIGCRYCMVACPFNVPKFQWNEPFPQIAKCELCYHRLETGDISACCEVCPTGASLFGPVEKLLAEAERRLRMTKGRYYDFPLADIRRNRTASHPAAAYNQRIYGQNEVGGTQVMIMAGVDFDKLGLPELPDKSYCSISEGIQHTLYKGMVAPAALLGVLALLVKRSEKEDKS